MYGSQAMWPLLAEVLEAVDVPILAAGGLADGRGMAAAIAFGAAGVRMGTRFVATAEAGAHPVYKDAIARATHGGTVLTDKFAVGWPDPVGTSRVLRSALQRSESLPEGTVVGSITIGPTTTEVPRFGFVPALRDAEGDIEAWPLYAGESAALIHAVEPARDIVERLETDATRLLRRAADALTPESEPAP